MNRKDRRAAGVKTADHGVFTIPPPPDEGPLLSALQERAPSNATRPGHAFLRLVGASRELGGRKVEGFRVYHLDQPGRQLTITEVWDGEETARITVKLDEDGRPRLARRVPDPVPAAKHREGVPVRPVRRALDGLSPHDADAIQDRFLGAAEQEVVTTGALAPRWVVVTYDHLEELRLAGLEPRAGALPTFAALGSRRDVAWRVLHGELPAPSGGPRTAFVIGAASGGLSWLATRTFTLLPGGLGSDQGSWMVATTDGRTPPEVVAQWGSSGAPWKVLPAAPPPPPLIGGAFEELPEGTPPPTDALQAAAVAAAMAENAAWRDPLEAVLVFVFRGRAVERWLVEGEIPWGLDDLVRALAANGDEPTAVATMRRDVVRVDGELRRGVVTVGEARGERYQRILALRYRAAGDAHPVEAVPLGEALPDPGSDGWIGVPPVTDLGLTPLSIDEA